MTPDPLLQALSRAAARVGEDAGENQGAVVHLVADGVIWQGRLVGPAVWTDEKAWAGELAQTPAEDDVLRDAAADADAYLHFSAASCYSGGKWLRMHGVRVAAAAVSAWWLNHTDE
jgi:hypothetical protein